MDRISTPTHSSRPATILRATTRQTSSTSSLLRQFPRSKSICRLRTIRIHSLLGTAPVFILYHHPTRLCFLHPRVADSSRIPKHLQTSSPASTQPARVHSMDKSRRPMTKVLFHSVLRTGICSQSSPHHPQPSRRERECRRQLHKHPSVRARMHRLLLTL